MLGIGPVGLAAVGQGGVRCGNSCDSSTGGLGSLCCSQREQIWLGWVGLGLGAAGPNGAWLDWVEFCKDCRRQYGGSGLPTVLSGTGMVWRFKVSSVNAWLGTASRGDLGLGASASSPLNYCYRA